jgi:hypothetical protein
MHGPAELREKSRQQEGGWFRTSVVAILKIKSHLSFTSCVRHVSTLSYGISLNRR